MDESRDTVEPVTPLAPFQLGYRFLVVGPRRECWGFHGIVEEARLAADRLNNPTSWSK